MSTRNSRRTSLNAMRRKSRRTERAPKVHDAVEIWWSVDKTFYRGTLTRRHGEDNFRVVYDDGEMEDLDLTKEFWRFADEATDERGSGQKDTSDIIEVVIDGSDSPAAQTPKQVKKPQKKKEKKTSDDKATDKKAGKQETKVPTGAKSNAAKNTPQQTVKGAGAPAKRSPETPASAKRVSDRVTPTTASETKSTPDVSSRTRAKPKTVKGKSVEKQSGKPKTQATKTGASPVVESSIVPGTQARGRGDREAAKPTPVTAKTVPQADESRKASASKDKSGLAPVKVISVVSPEQSDRPRVKGGSVGDKVTQAGLERKQPQDEVKMGPTKTIGKPKKAAQVTRAKVVKTKTLKGKADDSSQDNSLPPVEAKVKLQKPKVGGPGVPTMASRRLSVGELAPKIAASSVGGVSVTVPVKGVAQQHVHEKNESIRPEVAAERDAPSFAADRKRKKKLRSGSLPNGSTSVDAPKAGVVSADVETKKSGNIHSANVTLTKAKQEIKKTAGMPYADAKVSDGNAARTPGVDRQPVARAQPIAPKPVLIFQQPPRTTAIQSQGAVATGQGQKRNRTEQALSGSHSANGGTEPEAAAKRLRSSTSLPSSATPQKTSELQSGMGKSSENLMSLLTKAFSPSQLLIEGIRADVRNLVSAVTNLKQDNVLVKEVFQKTVLDDGNNLRTSIRDLRSELLEVVEQRAQETERRVTATMERLFKEWRSEVGMNGLGAGNQQNNREIKPVPTLAPTESCEAPRPQTGQHANSQPAEHDNVQDQGDQSTPTTGPQPVNGRKESPTTIANINQDGMEDYNTSAVRDSVKEEEESGRSASLRALLRARVSHLAARQVTVWLLETPHEYEPGFGTIKAWAKRTAALIFNKVGEQLMRFDSYMQAYQTLCSSLGNDAVELQWFVSPGVQEHLHRARRNYAAWDPPPTDEEWRSEVWLLKELSGRFSRALQQCEYSTMTDIQACIAVSSAAAMNDMSPGTESERYRNANGNHGNATTVNRARQQ